MRRRIGLLALGLALVSWLAAGAGRRAWMPVLRTEKASFRVVTLVTGLANPWGLAFLPDGRMLVTERPGRLRIVRGRALDPEPVTGLPTIIARGQGGLLDVMLHPHFTETGWVYLSFSAPGEGGMGTEVVRGRLRDHRFEDVQSIFRLHPKSDTDYHFGSRLLFDRDGYLYVTLGDRGEMAAAQRLGDHRGKIVRLHDDGRVPGDNPFRGRPGARPEIFTYGHRNVQGIAVHPVTGVLWEHEHGPQGGDEVNVLHPGRNYGWPIITYGVNYGTGTPIGEGTAKPSMEPPVHYWVPLSIAPSGMALYAGDQFPGWRGDLFVGALRDQMLVRLELDGERVVHEERMLKGTLGRIRDVRLGPDGLLYLLTDARRGVLARLEPVNP